MDDATARHVIAARRELIAGRLRDTERGLADVRRERAQWTDEEHDPEGFVTEFAWAHGEAARSGYDAELAALDDAETRIASGNYGVCEVCGMAIPDAQLTLRPARTSCVACAERAAGHTP